VKITVLGTRGFPNIQGGVEKHCENLYPELVKKGCEVVVFARASYVGKKSFVYERVKVLPLTCSKNKFLEAFGHTFKGVFAAKREGCDIIHFHAIGPSIFIPLAKILGLKTVMTHHGHDYNRGKWNKVAKIVLKTGEKWGSKWVNEVICISETIAEAIRKRFKRKVFVILNGVVVPQILDSDEAVKKYDLEKGKYILAVGRFVPEKGFHDLIDAFVDSKSIGWKLVIVGDADHEDNYSRRLKKKVAKIENVVLTGFLVGKFLEELYSHAGLFVLSFYHEGLPIVMLEAMSYGLSCIASDIPANKEVGLSNQRFFKAGDVDELAKKIKEFINKPLSDDEKEKQIHMVSKKYNWENIAKETLRVYKKVLT